MINDGFYCGRKFAFGPYTAIWFVEENQIKVFNPDGTVAHSASSEELTPSENAAEIRRAA